MKTTRTLLTATLIAAMTLAFTAWAAAYSYTETFGTGDSATLTSLGWNSIYGGDCSVDNGYGVYPGWGGRALNPFTATGTSYYAFEKQLSVVPGSGLWKFSACVYNISDGLGGRSYGQGSAVGLGRYNVQGVGNMSIGPVGYNANSWYLDARNFTGNPGNNAYLTYFGDGNFCNAPCLANIYIDFDNKKIWATMTNQNTGVSVTSSVINFTNWASFDAFNIGVDKRDYQSGMPMDNLSIVQEKLVTVSYQGKLTDNSQPINGTASVKFDLFTVEAGGSAIWSGTASTETVTDGIFSKSIGPVMASLFQANSTLWLEVTVNGQVMSPRAKLETAPYAATSYTTAP